MAAPKNVQMTGWFDRELPNDMLEIVRLNVTIGGKTVVRDFSADLDIEWDFLEKHLQDLPSIYAFWSVIFSEQKKQVAVIERQIKNRRAGANKEILDEARASDITLRADDVRNLIEQDKELNKLEAKGIYAKAVEGKLYNLLVALRMKSDHLRSLSAFKRAEFDGIQ